MKIAINGLGRIGRCVLRAFHERDYSKKDLEIVAVNSRSSISQHAHLLKYDSVHSHFTKDVTYDDCNLQIDGQNIRFYNESQPENIPWHEKEVDIVLECSGAFNQKEKAIKHNAEKVLVSAPVADADNTIIYGVNEKSLRSSDKVISVGSCTTNCLAPLVSVLHEKIGIKHGFMTTVHAYTNDQNIVDNSHKKDWRRARACGISMVPTSTGAAQMIGKIIPELHGKLDGTAVRVPVANVSMVDLKFNACRDTIVDEINSVIEESAAGPLNGVIDYCQEPLVSVDFTHNSNSTIFDGLETKVVDKSFVRVLSWYDNEWGFANRMLDVACLLKR